jgi:hypothetical protein
VCQLGDIFYSTGVVFLQLLVSASFVSVSAQDLNLQQRIEQFTQPVQPIAPDFNVGRARQVRPEGKARALHRMFGMSGKNAPENR